MNFYQNHDRTKFIAFDDTIVIVITESNFCNGFNIFYAPFKRDDGDTYEPSTKDEFFKKYNEISSLMNTINKTN